MRDPFNVLNDIPARVTIKWDLEREGVRRGDMSARLA